MSQCLISFGANLGQPADTIEQAAVQVQQRLTPGLRDFRMSRLFRTPAVGGPSGQPPFINAVAALEIDGRSAWDVWQAVRDTEHALGRVRMERWEARRIDLDVLTFDDQRIWTQHFKLPHPRMVMRRFILEPALDVAPQWREPVSGWSIDELARALRSGPASIALISGNAAQAQGLLERAAAQAQCAWITPRLNAGHATQAQQDAPAAPPQAGRWLGLVPVHALREARDLSIEPAPKLVFVLAEPATKPGAAWEDFHRPLANWLGLSIAGNHARHSHWPLAGPRYLLATDDLAWAEHEVIAALEAMDCPVEAIG
jgi:2-amino-4-hydroxy-6-hydroxymethyldihydropteridine diphosphokinase